MDEKLFSHLEKIRTLLDKSELIQKLLVEKQLVFQDKNLLDKIETYKKEPTNLELKKEIYENEHYRTYQALENELYFFILAMNQKLNSLTEGKVCQNESH